ncbi:diguanylate cyclase [Spirochaetia bacterium 38H-sp]|uniref:Diguanylate cyclase n=1 Tax=Rarispira pelagica TaxID=3141764 RepID=A0ABU9UCB8_9SPIR
MENKKGRKKNVRIAWYKLIAIKILFLHLIIVAAGITILFYFTNSLIERTIGTQETKKIQEETEIISETIENTGRHMILQELRQNVSKAIDICRAYQSEIQQHTHTPEEAKEHVMEYLKKQKIGESGYFAIVDSKANIIYHPQKELIGKNMANDTIIKRITEEKKGYFDYIWKNPGEQKARKKVLYMDYFSEWDWIVVATAYKEEYTSLIEENLLSDMLSAIVKNNKTFIMITSENNKRIISKNTIPDFSPNTYDITKNAIEDNHINYQYHGKTYVLVKNIIKDFSWNIFVIYSKSLLADTKNVLIRISGISLMAILVLSLFLTAYIYLRISRPIIKALPILKLATNGYLNARLKPVGHTELSILASYFNKLMLSLSQTIQEKNKAIAQSSFLGLFPQENPNPVIFINKDVKIAYANRTASRIFSIPEGYCNKELPTELKAIEENPGKNITITKDKTVYEFIPSPISKFDGIFYFGRDITKEKEYEKNLLIYKWLFEHAYEGMAITDEDGTIEQINPSFTNITGYTKAEAIGQNPRILKSEHHPPEFYVKMWNDLVTKGAWADEIWNRRKNGEVYPEWLSIFRIKDADKQVHYVGIFHDISNQKSMEEKLRHMAYHDALTGLPNRSLLNDRLKKHIAGAKRSGTSLAVVFIDMDNFKGINDTFGHKAGDLILKKIADILRKVCREVDTIARISGDEFALVLPDMRDRAFAIGVIKRIFKTAETNSLEYKGNSIPVSLSAGIAFYPDDGKTAEELLSHSDMALYRAKRHGKGRYEIYNKSDSEIVSRQMETYAFLREAVENNKINFLWKPWCTKEGNIEYLESTLRCNEADHLNTKTILEMIEQLNIAEEMLQTTLYHIAQLIEKISSGNIANFPDIVIRLPYSVIFSTSFSDNFIELCEKNSVTPKKFFFIFSSPVVKREKSKEAHPYILTLMEKGIRGSIDADWGIHISLSSYDEKIIAPFERLPNNILYRITETMDKDEQKTIEAINLLIKLKRYPDKKVVITDLNTEKDADFARKTEADLLSGPIIYPALPIDNIDAAIRNIK